jgi:hypothetical protein
MEQPIRVHRERTLPIDEEPTEATDIVLHEAGLR